MQSIKEKGLHVPIVVNQDGVVLDGHHRFKACKELGVPLQIHRKKFDDELDEKQFAIEINLERPQLNDFQKIELVYARERRPRSG